MISRKEQSNVLNNLVPEIVKKASIIERISWGFKRHDPFKEYASGDVWFIKNGKLFRRKKKGIKK